MTSALIQTVARLLLGPTLVVSAAILVKGYADVGDGFAAGVVAALALLLFLLAFGGAKAARLLPVRHGPATALVGLLLALVVAFVPALRGDAPLTHAPRAGSEPVHLGTLELVSAVAFDVGVFLLVVGVAVGVLEIVAREADRRR